ncbi:MAG: hypothetical protein ABSF26_07015 [Thermoguttaceae bacterium]
MLRRLPVRPALRRLWLWTLRLFPPPAVGRPAVLLPDVVRRTLLRQRLLGRVRRVWSKLRVWLRLLI